MNQIWSKHFSNSEHTVMYGIRWTNQTLPVTSRSWAQEPSCLGATNASSNRQNSWGILRNRRVTNWFCWQDPCVRGSCPGTVRCKSKNTDESVLPPFQPSSYKAGVPACSDVISFETLSACESDLHVGVVDVEVEAKTGSVLRNQCFRLLRFACVRLARNPLQFHQIWRKPNIQLVNKNKTCIKSKYNQP